MSRTVTMTLRVGWGDCDPAGIVYYPNFFRFCEISTWNYFAASGLPILELQARYGTLGLPLVGASAEFRAPARPQDELAVATRIAAWGRKTIELRHAVARGATPLLDAVETRVWAAADPTRPTGLRAQTIPREVVEHFAALEAAAARR